MAPSSRRAVLISDVGEYNVTLYSSLATMLELCLLASTKGESERIGKTAVTKGPWALLYVNTAVAITTAHINTIGMHMSLRIHITPLSCHNDFNGLGERFNSSFITDW